MVYDNFCHNHDKYIDKFRRFSLPEKNFLEQVKAKLWHSDQEILQPPFNRRHHHRIG
jgi:hypothetical protein